MLEKGTVVFGNWTVEERIGSGAFGTVYKIKREDFGEEYFAAMKVIRIPQDGDEKGRLHSEGMNDTDISLYYKQIAKDFIKEIKLLSSLDGVTNIVDYKDHIIETNDDFGYTIYIKMQLLTPLNKLLVDESNNAKFLSNEDILKLGKDICSALEVCERKKIIHRDIKIDNIFISEDGDYKLGDFGIARQFEATQGEMSKKGTLMYMAPEVFKGEKYDRTADIYSLGIVLYRLLNKNRAPFFPDYPQPIKFTDKEVANNKRLNGDELPDISGICSELNTILKKACAFNPRDRYQSANDFKAALEGVGENIIVPVVIPPVEPVIEDEKTADEVTIGIFDTALAKEPVVEETEAVFKETPIASVEPAVPVTEDTMEEEKTESVFGNEREVILSDSFYEKETVTLESLDEEKTESVFDSASVDTMEDDTFDEEKTDSVFASINDEKKVENELFSEEIESQNSNSGSTIASISIFLIIVILVIIISFVTDSKVNEDVIQETSPSIQVVKGEDYYEIDSAEELLWFAEEVNSGRNPSANAILMNDIDLNPGYIFNSDGTVSYNGSTVTSGWQSWEPIGYERPSSSMHYTGTFDGNGYTVSGVYFNNEERYAVGFFGYTDSATIKNLNVDNSYINGYFSVAGIVGYNNNGTVSCCSFEGTIDSPVSYIGGIVGNNHYGTVDNCNNNGDISGSASVGGLVGYNCKGEIISCSNNGSVSGYYLTGGVIGNNYFGTAKYSTNNGYISNDDYLYYGGGVVGYNVYGLIQGCTNNGNIGGDNGNIGGAYCIGGVVGDNYGELLSCINNGCTSGGTCVGGIAGASCNIIETCTNNSMVNGREYVGGVVGYSCGTISNCSYYAYSADYGVGYCYEHDQNNCTSHGVTAYY